VGMCLSCNFVNLYTNLVCIKSPKCHVVLLADVVVLLFLAMHFVTAVIFVYLVNVYDSSSCTHLHAHISNTLTEAESRFV